MTDIMGNILAIFVHAANLHDTKTGAYPLALALQKYPTIVGVCVDEGYRKTFEELVADFGLKCDVSERIKPKEWHILPKRWRVERTFGWFNGYRRLSKDYEISVVSAESMALIAHCRVLLKRLAY